MIMKEGAVTPIPKRKLEQSHEIKGLENGAISDFWSWGYSDLLCNIVRPVFAEYIVGRALGLTANPRIEWSGVDFIWQGKKIEVKSAAYLQSWPQKRYSAIRFDVSARKQSWDPVTGAIKEVNRRQADCYVFCLLAEKDGNRVDVMDLDQWQFYALPTNIINEKIGSAKSASLKFLEEQTSAIRYPALYEEIRKALIP